jgi:hypothetical protein
LKRVPDVKENFWDAKSGYRSMYAFTAATDAFPEWVALMSLSSKIHDICFGLLEGGGKVGRSGLYTGGTHVEKDCFRLGKTCLGM